MTPAYSWSFSGSRSNRRLKDLSLFFAISKLFGSGEASAFHNRPTEYLCPSKLTNSSNRVSAGSDFASSVDGKIPRASTSQNRLKSRLRRSSV
ncbi:hypothetical protein T11_5202 [Trichinella zimbabwensis]|uniref:Uncharacterized protein n=1 Tax=Trichinella zimbabwensis TaxID=268475 RepID=A0A0V1HC03_9BILA|nr:hypothetical protein T11_5202 [Trichinella zimbabwensis]